MNTDFSLIKLKLRDDLLRFRWVLALFWLALLAEAVLSWCLIPSRTSGGLHATLLFVEMAAALLITARVVQVDPLTGTTAFWLTRPIRRVHLFWSKTVFLCMALVLPWMVAFVIHALAVSAPGMDMLIRALIWLAVLTLTISTIATLASLTGSFFQFKIAAAGLLAGMVLFVSLLASRQVTGPMYLTSAPEVEIARRALEAVNAQAVFRGETLALVLLTGVAVAAWITRARFGRATMGVLFLAILALGPGPLTRLGEAVFRTNTPSPESVLNRTGLQIEVLAVSNPPPKSISGQVLWSHFRITGLKSNEYAVPCTMAARFSSSASADRTESIAIVEYRDLNISSMQSHSSDPFRAIQSQYPAETLWSGMWFGSHQTSLPLPADDDGKKARRFENARGTFTGSMLVDAIEMVREADFPLQAGAAVRQSGAVYWLQSVRLNDQGQLDITFNWCANNEHFGERRMRPGFLNEFAMVLYHPGTGEASITSVNTYGDMSLSFYDQHGGMGSVAFPVNRLRQKLAGLDMGDWMRQARLHVYFAHSGGSQLLSFADTNHVFKETRFSWDQTEGMDSRRMTNAPAGTDPGQIAARVEALCLALPEYPQDEARRQFKAALAPCGREALPALLGSLPVSDSIWMTTIRPEIENRITAADKPLLIEALRRDARLASMLIMKGWGGDILPVVVEQLPDHRVAMYPEAVVLAAGSPDSRDADLKWRFIYTGHSYDRMASVLQKRPGFPMTEAISEAWSHSRIERNTADFGLALLAAGDGLPGGFLAALACLEQQTDTRERQRMAGQLARLTDSSGPAGSQDRWLLQNAGRFQFDVATRRYTLPR
jgi:hypothetical protein